MTVLLKNKQVDTLSYKTKSERNEDVERKWYIVDAENVVLGRMASKVATVLRGKHKPSYTPHIDTGDYVIIVNAGKVRFTGDKLNQKEYITFSGYTGGQKRILAKELIAKKPIRPIELAVKGMLPKGKLGRAMYKKLFVYAGSEHPHAAQQPETLEI
jgi:large subunit ribosomal protein L13